MLLSGPTSPQALFCSRFHLSGSCRELRCECSQRRGQAVEPNSCGLTNDDERFRCAVVGYLIACNCVNNPRADEGSDLAAPAIKCGNRSPGALAQRGVRP